MNRNLRRRFLAALITFPLAGAAAACGSDDDSTSSTDSTVAVATEPTEADTVVTTAQTDPPESSAAPSTAVETTPEETAADTSSLDDLIAAANEEGALMIYSEMAPTALENISAAFEAAYPEIDVEFVRDIHPNLAPPLEIEISSGQGVGDVFITTNTPWFESKTGTGAFLPLEGSELAGEGAFDPSSYVKNDDYLITGGTINVFAWNTEEVPEGIDDLEDLLDPAFDGRIGLPDPVAPVNVEWYTWFEEKSGITLEELAELHPRIYPGAVPLNEGLGSGEIAVTPYAFPTIVGPSQAAGAPVDFAVPTGDFWGAQYNAAVPSSAPHPAAAMLFLNFAVTPEAQAVLNDQAAAVVPDTALGLVADMAPPYGITNDDLTEFQGRFHELISS